MQNIVLQFQYILIKNNRLQTKIKSQKLPKITQNDLNNILYSIKWNNANTARIFLLLSIN